MQDVPVRLFHHRRQLVNRERAAFACGLAGGPGKGVTTPRPVGKTGKVMQAFSSEGSYAAGVPMHTGEGRKKRKLLQRKGPSRIHGKPLMGIRGPKVFTNLITDDQSASPRLLQGAKTAGRPLLICNHQS
jgi:hypothetical protein